MLVEGLNTGKETSLEEYIMCPSNVLNEAKTEDKYQIMLYGAEEGVSYIAKPVTGLSLTSHHGSAANQSSFSLKDPLVTLFSSVHEKLSERGSKGSSMLPFLGSVLVNAGEHHSKHWDMESQTDDEGHESETSVAYGDDSLRSPLISRQTTSVDNGGSSVLGVRGNTVLNAGEAGNSTSSIDIGGGWQLAYKYAERVSEDGKKEGGVQRVYLHQESALGSQPASVVSISGVISQENKAIQAAALVSPPMIPPPEAVVKGPKWRELLEPGVKRALVVGIGLQVLEQVKIHFMLQLFCK